MPVRSLTSSVLVWPDRDQVDAAARTWATEAVRSRSTVERIGYFGSYARDDYGVGSDLDLVAIVEGSDEPFERRSVSWPLETLPVPADLLVYTADEWARLLETGNRFARVLSHEMIWIWP